MSGCRCFAVFFAIAFLCLLIHSDAASIHRNHRETTPTCGYQSCPAVDAKKLNIHLVAHTHDDVGWLKTVDQYYFGSRSQIQKAGVQYILDSVVQALLADPSRKFIYVETAFLWKWWLRQNDRVKEDVRTLINEGRLEIIGGGWSMNDEATTHYHSIVDQFAWGFRRLNDTFGSCARPRIGWQIDPFGHSREQASIFAQMGFDGMLFGRMDYQDKSQRLTDQTMEFVWKSSPSLGKRANLFTAAMYNTYSPPPGFCFDVLCADEPIIDDPESPDYNVEERIGSFWTYAEKQAAYYRTNNVILTMGGDFTYQHAEMYYTNLDKLIRYTHVCALVLHSRKNELQEDSSVGIAMRISHETGTKKRVQLFSNYARIQAEAYKTNNIILTMGDDFNYQHAEMWFTNLDRLIRFTRQLKGEEVNIFYSTPSCYLKALHDQNLVWPTKSDDFFPYASDPHAFWTGYFVSRPTIKFFERMGNNLLQIGKQIAALTGLEGHEKELDHFREAMGMMQHHDAVTGTEKQLVADDYSRILYQSMQNGENLVVDALKKWSSKEQDTTNDEATRKMFSCMELNITSCPYTESSKSYVLSLYNPLSKPITTYVRVPAQGNAYTVTEFASHGARVASQVVPIPESVQHIPGRRSKATKELVFAATVPALGYKMYTVVEVENAPQPVYQSAREIHQGPYTIEVNPEGEVVVVYNEGMNKKLLNYQQSFQYYIGAEGDNKVFENRSSGAYIFRPTTVEPHSFEFHGRVGIYQGPVVQEIHQKVNEWISQVIRLYGSDYVEFEWLVGPIPVADKIGKEIVTKYTTNLNTKGEFYTDANGREMLKRKRDYRPTWQVKLEEPVAGNYYPVTSKISLKDEEEKMRFSVLVDRAQGGSSMKDGEVEVMIHRRLLRDDAFGVGEALNESAFGEGLVVRGKHYVIAGHVDDLDKFALKEKDAALRLSLRPWTVFTPMAADDFEGFRRKNSAEKSGLAKPLPPNVHILTLEPWKDDTILLRLEHLFEVGEAKQLSQPAEVNLKDLFSTFDITSIEETTLGGNQWSKDLDRMEWKAETNDVLDDQPVQVQPVQVREDAINVLLNPMEIRTFIIKVSPRQL